MNSIRISIVAVVVAIGLRGAPQDATQVDAATLANRALQLQSSGDYDGAAAAYRELLKVDPNQVATHVNLGVVLVNSGHYDEALAEYAAAEKLLPGDPRIALNIALAYEKSGRIQPALNRFDALHAADPDNPKITMLLADCNLQMGKDARVIELLRPLHTQVPDDLGVVYMLGMALLRTGKTDEGGRMLDQILKNGDSAESRFLLGVRIFEGGDYPAAVRQFSAAIALNPKLPGLQSYYGLALLNTGDPDAAAAAFERELEADPNNYSANLGSGQILEVRRRYADALPRFRRALELRPGSADAQLGIAECLGHSGSFAAARSFAESAVAAKPNSKEAHAALLTVYSGLNLQVEAEAERQKIRALAAAERAFERGPKLSEHAPDFNLPDALSGAKVHLADLSATKPTVLVFGSYTCPNFRVAVDALKAMHDRYRDRVNFLLVYIREAHASDQWRSTQNDRESVNLAPAANMAEKEEHAQMCSRKLHLNFPAVVDSMDGAIEESYHAWPSRAFILDTDRRIVYSTRLTELDFDAIEMNVVLEQISARKAQVARGKQP